MVQSNVLVNPDGSGLQGAALLRAIRQEAMSDPESALNNLEHYIDRFPKNEDKRSLILTALLHHPENAMLHADQFMKYFSAREQADIVRDQLRFNPESAVFFPQNTLSYLPENERAQAVIRAGLKAPGSIYNNPEPFMSEIPSRDRAMVVRKLAAGMPDNLQGFRRIIATLPGSDQDEVAAELERNFLLGGTNASSISDAPDFSDFVSRSRGAELAALRDKRTGYLKEAQQLNYAHDQPFEERFAAVRSQTPDHLYSLMVLGRSELYTSSYMGVMDFFASRMKSEGKNVFDVMGDLPPTSIMTFLEGAASYNKLDRALSVIPKGKWGEILETFGAAIDRGEGQMSVALVDVMNKMPDPEIRNQMERFIENKYQTSTGEQKDFYGLLGTHYNNRMRTNAIHIDHPERYQTDYDGSSTTQLSHSKVMGQDGIFRQLSVFPEDEDGQASFSNFMRTYQGNKNYKIQQTEDYVKITPTNGAKMEIYANKPGHSPDKILQAIGGPDATPESVEIDMVVNRGHSYNFGDTMPYFSKNTSLAFLGSCGGYGEIGSVLEVSPGMQVIATKQTGAMAVNDPLLLHINESVRMGKPIVWEQESAFLKSLNSPHKEGYIMPDQNTALLMQRQINFFRARELDASPQPWMTDTVQQGDTGMMVGGDGVQGVSELRRQLDLLDFSSNENWGLDWSSGAVQLNFEGPANTERPRAPTPPVQRLH